MNGYTEIPEASMPVLEDFQLLPQLKADGESDAYIPIGWCLSPEAADALKRREATDAQMVIIVAGNYGTEDDPYWRMTDMRIVKLTSLMTYIRFNHPGENRIYGVIAWPNADGTVSSLKKLAYDNTPVNSFSGDVPEFFLDSSTVDRLRFAFQQNVNVPKEAFAEEPGRVRKALVRKFFRRREDDQCHFRRRTIISALWLVPYIVLSTFVRVIYALFAGVLMGHRGINWIAVVRPFKYDTGDVWYHVRRWRCWWNYRRDGSDRPGYWVAFQPISYLVMTWFLFMMSIDRKNGHFVAGLSLWQAFLWAVILHLTIFAIVGVAALIYLGVNLLRSSGADERQRKASAERVQRQQSFVSEVDTLVCSTAPRVVSLGDLPKDKQTITLRMSAVKRGVCKPFAK